MAKSLERSPSLGITAEGIFDALEEQIKERSTFIFWPRRIWEETGLILAVLGEEELKRSRGFAVGNSIVRIEADGIQVKVWQSHMGEADTSFKEFKYFYSPDGTSLERVERHEYKVLQQAIKVPSYEGVIELKDKVITRVKIGRIIHLGETDWSLVHELRRK